MHENKNKITQVIQQVVYGERLLFYTPCFSSFFKKIKARHYYEAACSMKEQEKKGGSH